jgi:hypothetical protein
MRGLMRLVGIAGAGQIPDPAASDPAVRSSLMDVVVPLLRAHASQSAKSPRVRCPSFKACTDAYWYDLLACALATGHSYGAGGSGWAGVWQRTVWRPMCATSNSASPQTSYSRSYPTPCLPMSPRYACPPLRT